MPTTEELYKRIFELEAEIERLKDDKEHLEQEIKDLIQDRDENYRPIPVSEQVWVNDYDFI